jgi:hypothetical protein
MSEIEVPTEHLHEAIKEKAEAALKGIQHKEKAWSLYVAISTALMAVLAAISSLFAGHHSNEALVDQIRASDQWAYYQAKGIKAEIKSLAYSLNQAKPEDIARYRKEQEEIKKNAEELQHSSVLHLETEKKFAKAVTFFQIAIAIAAIAILTDKKFLWLISLVIGVCGIIFIFYGSVSSYL